MMEKEEFEHGLTFISSISLFYAALCLLPVALYMTMMTGSAGSFSAYVGILLFSEIMRLSGRRLKPQEVFVLYYLLGYASSWFPFYDYIYRRYYVESPVSFMFIDPSSGKPVPYVVPSWWAPPYGSPYYNIPRGYLALTNEYMLIPILLGIIGYFIWWLTESSLALIISQIYLEAEPLPFPLARIDTEMIITLTERDTQRMIPLIIGGVIGMVWGFVLYAFPFISWHIAGVPYSFLPVPWVDMGNFIEQFMPGAIFGIATDLTAYFTGFFLPTSLVIQILCGSFAIWIIGNWLTARGLLSEYFPQWRSEWSSGMPINLIWQRSYLWVWASFHVGVIFSAAVVPMILKAKIIYSSFKSLLSLKKYETRYGAPPLAILLAMFFAGTGISLIIFHLLIPDFPIWISASFSFGWTFLYALSSARAIGTTGSSIPVQFSPITGATGLATPIFWNGIILATGYNKPDIWFIAPYVRGDWAASWVQTLKVAQLTKTRFFDFFKGILIITPLVWIMSFIYVGFFWQMSPIPSSAYPWTAISWPINVISSNLWVSRSLEIFKPDILIGSFIGMSIIGLVGELLLTRFIPFSMIGLVAGMSTLPPYAIAILISNMLGRFFFSRVFGQKRWSSSCAPLCAGIALGEGIITGIGISAVLIYKAMWSLPF
jgi:hypothetical protein